MLPGSTADGTDEELSWFLCQICGAYTHLVLSGLRICPECYQHRFLSTPQIICQFCTDLFTANAGFLPDVPTGDGDLDDNVLRPNAPNWILAAVDCPLCHIFLSQDPNPDEGRYMAGLFIYPLIRNHGVGPRDIEGFYFESEPDQYRLTLSVSALEGDPSSKYVSQRPPETYLGCAAMNQQIQSWLSNCLTCHEGCHSSLSLPSQLPTRVIDVGKEQNSTPRIVESLETPHYGKYVALSYCWGREPFLTTTSRNIESFKNELNLSILPQTFKDAIVTTRALGFRYLWVDALCILQDSSDDKAREISRMGDIYHGAILTLASVGATKVADGFLNLKAKPVVTLPYKCPDGEIGSVQVAEQKVVDLHRHTLYTRAWCMQENLLSPRMLIYTDDEVLWQCQTDHMKRPDTCHVAYEDDDPILIASPFMRLSPDLFSSSQTHIKPGEIQTQEFYTRWTTLVQAYTRRQLTVFSDRLPAIGGVAAHFQNLSPATQYYAGHWQHLFIALLAWRRSRRRPIPAHIPLTQYRAPSWSWASVEGPVEFESSSEVGNIRNLQADFISCTVKPVSQMNPLGEVRSGKAVINASMLRLWDAPFGQILSRGTTIFNASRRQAQEHPDDNNGFMFHGWSADSPRDMPPFDSSDNGSQSAPLPREPFSMEEWEKSWLMLLGELAIGRKSTKTKALVLMPVEEEGVNTFRRIGFFETDKKAASKEWLKAKDRRTITII